MLLARVSLVAPMSQHFEMSIVDFEEQESLQNTEC
jgi:hypothetical protein